MSVHANSESLLVRRLSDSFSSALSTLGHMLIALDGSESRPRRLQGQGSSSSAASTLSSSSVFPRATQPSSASTSDSSILSTSSTSQLSKTGQSRRRSRSRRILRQRTTPSDELHSPATSAVSSLNSSPISQSPIAAATAAGAASVDTSMSVASLRSISNVPHAHSKPGCSRDLARVPSDSTASTFSDDSSSSQLPFPVDSATSVPPSHYRSRTPPPSPPSTRAEPVDPSLFRRGSFATMDSASSEVGTARLRRHRSFRRHRPQTPTAPPPPQHPAAAEQSARGGSLARAVQRATASRAEQTRVCVGAGSNGYGGGRSRWGCGGHPRFVIHGDANRDADGFGGRTAEVLRAETRCGTSIELPDRVDGKHVGMLVSASPPKRVRFATDA